MHLERGIEQNKINISMKKLILLILVFSLSLGTLTAQSNKDIKAASDSTIIEALEMVRADSLLSYMQAMQDFETRFMLAPNRREVATWIMNRFLSFGVPEVRLDSFLCYTGFGFDTLTWQYNVEAKISGTIYPGHEVMIMGHYDSFVSFSDGNPFLLAPGADDNASGVAALLECARVMMQMQYQPQKTVIFLATAAEELMYSGDSGAKYYAQQAYNDNRKLGMIINNDMIAWNDGSWTLNLKYPDNSLHIKGLALQVMENYTTLNHIFGHFWTFADLEPFVEKGFHGMYFSENFTPNFYPYYHTYFDVVNHLDTAYHAEITKLNLGMIMQYDLITTDAAITGFNNIPAGNCTGQISPSIMVANYGSDTINTMTIVYQVNLEEPQEINWTGSIAFLETLYIELPELLFDVLSDNELYVAIENINEGEDQNPVNNSMSYAFGQAMPTPQEVKLRIRLDSKPHETTWDIKDANGNVFYSGGPYATPNVTINETMIFNDGCYTFTIYDAGGDGLMVPGHFLLFYGSNNQILFGHSFGSKAQTQFDVGNTLRVPQMDDPGSFRFYPNPLLTDGFFEFELKTRMAAEVSVYNLLGIKVIDLINNNIEPGLHRVHFDAESLTPGLYIISARLGNNLITMKMLKQ